MENIFTLAESCLHQTEAGSKIATTHKAIKMLERGELSFKSTEPIKPISLTRFPNQPQLLSPRDMPKRSVNSPLGKVAFFHALAHIEFVAIYLAWDILYRFRGLPNKFYQDWLRVADEEAQHFTLIRSYLLEMGADYGELPAHSGLWEHAEETSIDVLDRLALVPRCMEARGLDVTPQMIEKFNRQGDNKSVVLLTKILEDEIEHVKLGSYWFKTICQQRGINHEEKYVELIEKFYVGKPKGPFNRELRIIAGFSNAEIDWLEQSV
ncbi:MAG: ferritin-like domain-containing protein [Methylococcales bacterium]